MSNNIDQIQEIRDRQAAATPGPWTHSRWAPGYVVTDDDKFDVVASVVEYRENGSIESKFCGYKSLANRELIAHAPDDIAYLLSEYDRLTRYLERIGVTFGEFECHRLAREALSHLKG